jgi:hypothetical protein
VAYFKVIYRHAREEIDRNRENTVSGREYNLTLPDHNSETLTALANFPGGKASQKAQKETAR